MDAGQISLRKLSLLAAFALATVPVAQAQAPTFSFPQGTSVTLIGLLGAQLQVQSTGAAIAYSTSTSYAGGEAAWLNVNNLASFSGSTAGNGSVLFFQLGQFAGQLRPGTHTATVTLAATDGSGATGTITVSYATGSGGGGGGGGAGITATPNPLTATVTPPAQSNVTLQLTTGSASPLTFTIEAPTVSWLTLGVSSGTVTAGNPTNVSVNLNSFGLGVTTYNTNIIIDYSGTTLSVPVIFNVGTSGGGGGGGGGGGSTGSLTVNPLNVPWSYSSTNPSQFPSQFVTLSSSVATSYSAFATSDTNWLLVNNGFSVSGYPISGGLTLSSTSNIAALGSGTYTGRVTVTASDNSTATIVVTLTVNGSTSTGIVISPSPITFAAALNGTPVTQVVNVTSSTAGTFSASVTGSGLSISPAPATSIAAGGTVAVTIVGTPGTLATNVYPDSFTATVNGVSLTASVSFTVGNPGTGGGGGGGTTATAVTPSTLTYAYQTGSPQAMRQSQLVYLSGTGAFSTSVSPTTAGWITVSPASGVAPGFVKITADASTLGAGSNQGTVSFITGQGTLSVGVNLNVGASAVLYVPDQGDVTFNYVVGTSATTLPPQSFSVYASDNSNIAVTAAVTNPSATPWLTISANNTTTPAGFGASANPAGLANGVYSGSITLTSAASNSGVTVPVVLVVTGGANSSGSLTLGASSLNFTAQVNGAIPGSQVLGVTAASTTSFTASVANGVANNITWLSISPSGTAITPQNVTVSVNQSGLPNGTYIGQVNLTANGITQTVQVNLVVNATGTGTGGNVTVTANGGSNTSPTLSFTTPSGTNPTAQFIGIASAAGSAGATFTVASTTTDGNNWLIVGATPGVQISTPVTLNVSINVGTLPGGTYNGKITITPTNGTAVTVPVTLVVQGAPTITAPTTPVNFAYQAGGSIPAAQNIQVTGANGTGLSFTAQAISSGWLSVTPTNATAPATLSVSISPAGLSAGSYTGTITVAGTNGAGGSTSITVNLTITAPLPTITNVVNAASFASGAVAPGEIITIVGTAIGPGTAATLTLDSTGKVATSLAGVQVLFNGFAAPLTYVSTTQINAIAPYEVAGILNPSVVVKFLGQSSNGFNLNRAATVPAIFTANSSGSGPGAILNGDNSPNSASNPAARGSIVQVFLTGEGQTSPVGVTGKVTTGTSLSQFPVPALPVGVLVNNQPADFTYAGEAPGLVSGVLQVNVVIPPGIVLPAGTTVLNAPITILVGGNGSQTGVTVAIK